MQTEVKSVFCCFQTYLLTQHDLTVCGYLSLLPSRSFVLTSFASSTMGKTSICRQHKLVHRASHCQVVSLSSPEPMPSPPAVGPFCCGALPAPTFSLVTASPALAEQLFTLSPPAALRSPSPDFEGFRPVSAPGSPVWPRRSRRLATGSLVLVFPGRVAQASSKMVLPLGLPPVDLSLPARFMSALAEVSSPTSFRAMLICT